MKNFYYRLRYKDGRTFKVIVKGESINNDDTVYLFNNTIEFNKKYNALFPHRLVLVDKATGVFITSAYTKKELISWLNSTTNQNKLQHARKGKTYLKLVEEFNDLVYDQQLIERMFNLNKEDL